MEEEITVSESERGETVSRVNVSNNSPVKRGRGRSQGSKKLKVCVTDVNLTKMLSANSAGHPQTGRGHPRLLDTEHTKQQGSGDQLDEKSPRGRGRPKGFKKQSGNEDRSKTEQSVRKRGRPKKSAPAEDDAGGELVNGGSDAPQRGSRKRSIKLKESLTSEEEEEEEEEGSSSGTPRKRGRPKHSLNKKPRLEKVGKTGADGGQNLIKSIRGRPRKVAVNNVRDDASNSFSKTPQKGRGRPRKGDEQRSGAGEQVTGRKRGRPRQQPAKRGRPRKYPLPSPEEQKKPKMWKPLGRPRKYPRVEPPEGTPLTPPRGRGRPRKSESKKGAHLRKSVPPTPSTPHTPADGPQRKRGRPPSTPKNEGGAPRKRGRPKGSVNKNKSRGDTQLHGSKAESPAAGLERDAELVVKEAELDTEATPIKRGKETGGTVQVKDVNF